MPKYTWCLQVFLGGYLLVGDRFLEMNTSFRAAIFFNQYRPELGQYSDLEFWRNYFESSLTRPFIWCTLSRSKFYNWAPLIFFLDWRILKSLFLYFLRMTKDRNCNLRTDTLLYVQARRPVNVQALGRYFWTIITMITYETGYRWH